jgi:hypothetical protein
MRATIQRLYNDRSLGVNLSGKWWTGFRKKFLAKAKMILNTGIKIAVNLANITLEAATVVSKLGLLGGESDSQLNVRFGYQLARLDIFRMRVNAPLPLKITVVTDCEYLGKREICNEVYYSGRGATVPSFDHDISCWYDSY